MFKVIIEGSTVTELRDKIADLNEEFGHTTRARITGPLHISKEQADLMKAAANKELEQKVVAPILNPVIDAVSKLIGSRHEPKVNVTGPTMTSQGEVDSTGLPWDARIHADSRNKTSTGKWSRRRGLEEGLEAEVEAELRGAQAQPTFQAPVQPATQPRTMDPIPTTEQRVALPSEPSPLSQLAAAPQTAPQSFTINNVHTPETFRAQLVNILNGLGSKFTSSEQHQQYIKSLKDWFGKEIWEFQNDTAKCDQLFDSMVSQGFITKV